MRTARNSLPVDPASRWPPTPQDQERLANYATYLKLFLGRHQEVFDPYRPPEQGPYVTTNLLGAISRLLAQRLFGEPPQARVRLSETDFSPSAPRQLDPSVAQPSPRPDQQQALLDFLCQTNHWPRLCYSGALGGSYRGDTVFKVRYDALEDAVRIEEVAPEYYFPQLDPSQPGRVQAVLLAWPIGSSTTGAWEGEWWQEDSQPRWLRVEYHTPGQLENQLWELTPLPGRDYCSRRRVELSTLEVTASLPEVVQTGLELIPLVHIANRPVAENGIWGQSDYADLVSLQQALNRRRTQSGHILDKHADPLLAIDESFLDEQGRLPMERLRAIPLVQDEPPPQYITWDGKLADSRAEADSLLQAILLVAGISPESMGFAKGAGPESGLAIRLRQMLTTSTVAGKRLQWEPALRCLLSLATHMFVAHVRQPRRHGLAHVQPLAPEEISLEFGEGLPADFSAAIRDEIALQGAGLASREASLKRLFPNWSAGDLAQELNRLNTADDRTR